MSRAAISSYGRGIIPFSYYITIGAKSTTMTEYDPTRRPEPIPLAYANNLTNVTQAHLDELAAATTQMLASGRPASDVIQSLVQAGWDQAFTRWFVGVFASGGRVDTTPPVMMRPATYINPVPPSMYSQPVQDPGNFWDRQAAPYKEGSFAVWFHVFCCQCPGVVIALLLIAGCRTEQGKENGQRLLKYSLAGIGVAIVLRVLVTLANSAGK